MRTKVGMTGGHQQQWFTTDSDGWPLRLGKLVGDGGWVANSGHREGWVEVQCISFG